MQAPQTFAQRSQRLLAAAFKVSVLEMVFQAIGFLVVVVKFRYFGAAIMGLIGYFGALGEIPGAFYTNFNRSLVRFVPPASPRRRAELFLASFVFQAAIVAVLLLLLGLVVLLLPKLAFWRTHTEAAGIDASFAAAFTAAIMGLAMVQSWLSAMTSALQRFVTVQLVKIVNALIQVGIIGALSLLVADLERGLWVYYWMQTGLIVATILFLGWKMWSWAGLGEHLSILRPSEIRRIVASVYHEQLKYYTLPHQYTALVSYVKENLAVLLLGQMGMLADAGLYNLANRIYAVPRRLIPSVVDLMLPKFIKMAETEKERFRSRYNDFTWLQFALHAAMATGLFAGLPILQWIFGVEGQKKMGLIFFLFSANLAINALTHSNRIVMELGKDMRWYALSVTIRMVVVVGITFLLVPLMGSAGATLALALSTLVVFLMMAWDTRRTDLMDWNNNIRQFLVWAALVAAWSALFFLFPDRYPFHW